MQYSYSLSCVPQKWPLSQFHYGSYVIWLPKVACSLSAGYLQVLKCCMTDFRLERLGGLNNSK